jgi:hypothetical protein
MEYDVDHGGNLHEAVRKYMIMTPSVRNVALTAHVTSSVGWLGAVAAFLALAIGGLSSPRAEMVRAAYLAMELTGWFVIVPLCFASLLTGLVESLGTSWGLFRHYWIVAKLLIAVVATVLLVVHMRPVSFVASVAAQSALSRADLRQLRVQLVADSAAAVLALLAATTLSIYKPRGLTTYGRRKQEEQAGGLLKRDGVVMPRTSAWVYVAWFVGLVLVLLFAILHLTGRGLGGHHHL